MDLFDQRAFAILETARIGDSENLTVTFECDGGLHLVMGGNPGPPQLPANHATATYQMMRKGKRVLVSGREGNKACALEAPVAPFSPALLLNNQVLYHVPETRLIPRQLRG